MKIILFSVGTRGDMEPFVALASLFKEKGHEVILAFPEQFRKLAEAIGVHFESLGKKFVELLDSPAGKDAMGGASGFKKIKGTIALAINQKETNKELVKRQYEILQYHEADRVLYNGKAVYPLIWTLDHPDQSIFISPLPYMHYVKGHTHIAFNSNFGAFFNKLTFALANFGLRTTVNMSNKWLGNTRKIRNKEIMKVIKANKSIYTISPSLFPRPKKWPNQLQVLGFRYKKSTRMKELDADIQKFIARHPKILFVTFGSMINPHPKENTNFLLKILKSRNIPAVINTADGGLIKVKDYHKELFYFTKTVDYEALFPHMYALMHHGGSGTTHLGLRHACATLIIPHIIDQFVWNQIVSDLGAGPKGPKISKFRSAKTESKIMDLWSNPDYKHQAEKLAEEMANEDFDKEILNMVTG